MKELLELYWSFLKIGGLTFGGGLTMLPMLTHELVQNKNWITEDELLDCYAIGQCTPGIIAVNTATFVGYKRRGVIGGIFATMGMVTPSFVIITILALFLQSFMDNVWVQHAMMGVRGVVCALMLNTVITLAKKSLIDKACIAICIIGFILAMFTKIPTVLLIIAAGIIGIILKVTAAKKMESGKGE